jgi:short-subunit dehydrogenase involved in D-alanine esterification of teichoic acids
VALGTVLITGASTGIGEATTHHLKELGFDAVGAVRRPQDAERVRSAGLRTVALDVTDPESIAAAGAALGDGPLAGLVNNAGIAVAAPLEFLPLEQLRRQLEVNLIGQVAVIQRFLASLRAGRGRIIERVRGIEPREVAESIAAALTAKRPRARYVVGTDAKLRAPMAAVLPDRVMDRLIARAMRR